MIAVLLPVLLLSSFGLVAGAQEVLRSWRITEEFAGPSWPQGDLPRVVGLLSDLDKDGFKELVLGNPTIPAGGIGTAGKSWVISGDAPDGMVALRTYAGEEGSTALTLVGSVGDWNGDGFVDYYVGSPFAPVPIYSGQTGEILFVMFGRPRQVTLLDIDGDDREDFLFTASISAVYVDGGVEPKYFVTRPLGDRGEFGESSANLGDLDGDEVDDFAIGSPVRPGEFVPFVPGMVYVYSGAGGQVLYSLRGDEPRDSFGSRVVAIGDLTGDGRSELAVNAGSGPFTIHDGPSGARLFRYVEPKGELQEIFAAPGDLNGNGTPDLVLRVLDPVVPFRTLAQYTDGVTGRVLWSEDRFALRQDGIDFDGDEFLDHLTLRRTDAGPPYDLIAVSGLARGATAIGRPCAMASGAKPVIGIDREPFIGEDLIVNLSNVPPDIPVFLLVGDQKDPLSGRSSPSFMLPCWSMIQPKQVLAMRTEELIPGKGSATAYIPIPDDPSALGMTSYVQWLIPELQNGVGFAASRTLRIRVSDCLSSDSCP